MKSADSITSHHTRSIQCQKCSKIFNQSSTFVIFRQNS